MNQAYVKYMQDIVKNTAEQINQAKITGKSRKVWQLVDQLTRQELTSQSLQVNGRTASDRLNVVKDYFSKLLNPQTTTMEDSNNQSAMLQLQSLVHPPETEYNCEEITVKEIIKAAKSMSRKKAPGPDKIPVECYRIVEMAQALHPIFNAVFSGSQQAPLEWRRSTIVPIPKKVGARLLTDHRGISLMSSSAKLYNRILYSRIAPKVDPLILDSQSGFRPQRSTIDHIFALRRICEEANAHKLPLVVLFVDFNKAFDSVDRTKLPWILSTYGIPAKLSKAICSLYELTEARVKTRDGETEWFSTNSGILQGDTLAPLLFLLYIDLILRHVTKDDQMGLEVERRRSTRHPAKYITALAYADDVALVTSSMEGAQILMSNLVEAALPLGLSVNATKTQVMTFNIPNPVTIIAAGQPLSKCDSYTYLGSIIPCMKKDFSRRKSLAWAAMSRLGKVWNSPVDDRCKGALFKATVETIFTYGAESWSMSPSIERVVAGAHNRMLRSALRVPWHLKETNRDIQAKAGICSVIELINKRRTQVVELALDSDFGHIQPLVTVLFWCPEKFRLADRNHRITTMWESLRQCAESQGLSLEMWIDRVKEKIACQKREKKEKDMKKRTQSVN
jgi:hypothetical protein